MVSTAYRIHDGSIGKDCRCPEGTILPVLNEIGFRPNRCQRHSLNNRPREAVIIKEAGIPPQSPQRSYRPSYLFLFFIAVRVVYVGRIPLTIAITSAANFFTDAKSVKVSLAIFETASS